MVKKILNNRRWLLLAVIVILAGLIWLGFSYYQAQSKLKALSDPQQRLEMEQAEVQNILKRVSRHILVPEGEEPTVATINDVARLAADQPFYEDAVNGDKVLVFVKNKVAIIYSPKRDIIVNMGPIVLNEDKPAGSAEVIPSNNIAAAKGEAATSSASIKDLEINSPTADKVVRIIKIDVRNGSNITNAAKTFADLLPKDKYQVTNIGNAVKKNYQGNTIINLKAVDMGDLNNRLQAQIVEKLPSGEAASTADVVVIIGNVVK